jgi:glycosyltransferase involved in cell wall biosynthesis
MKIGLIANTFQSEKGTGIARYADELMKGLIEKGFSVKPICSRTPSIPMCSLINHSLLFPAHILREIKNVDIVHATSPATAIAFPLIWKPKIITYHDMTSMLCRDSGSAFYAKSINPFVYKMIALNSTKILANSEQTKQELTKNLKISSQKISVVNLGISNKFYPQLTTLRRDSYVIGYLGSLAARKRIEYLIDAFNYLIRSYPDLRVKLMIYGGNEQSISVLSQHIKELGIVDRIELMGIVPDEMINNIYNSFDVFVLPSEWEGFGIPILEAQRCGVPVVIRDDAHIPDETAKYCIKARSKEDMANKIYQLLIDKEFREDITSKGLDYSRHFTWDKTVESTIKIYEDILD